MRSRTQKPRCNDTFTCRFFQGESRPFDGSARGGGNVGKTAMEGETTVAKKAALRGLANLANTEENRAKFVDRPGVVDALLKATDDGVNHGIKEVGLRANTMENQVRLFERPGVMAAMLFPVTDGETNEIEKVGLYGLQNLSKAEENRVRLLETPGVVDAMLKAARNEDSQEIQFAGLNGLQALLLQAEAKIFNLEAVADVMLHASKSEKSIAVKEGRYERTSEIDRNKRKSCSSD